MLDTRRAKYTWLLDDAAPLRARLAVVVPSPRPLCRRPPVVLASVLASATAVATCRLLAAGNIAYLGRPLPVSACLSGGLRASTRLPPETLATSVWRPPNAYDVRRTRHLLT